MVIFRHQSITVKCDQTKSGYKYPITNVTQFNYGFTCETSELLDFFKDYKIKVSQIDKPLLNKGYFPDRLFIEFLTIHDIKDLRTLPQSFVNAIALNNQVEQSLKSSQVPCNSACLILRLVGLYGKALSEGKDLTFIRTICDRIESRIENNQYDLFIQRLESIWMSGIGDWFNNPHAVVKQALESFE